MKSALALLCLCSVALLGACEDGDDRDRAPAASQTPASESPAPTLPLAGREGMTPAAGVEAELREHLAARLGVAAAAVTVVSFTPATWPDGCLGIASPGTACTQALVPGWLAVLRSPGGLEYRYRGAGASFAAEP